MNNEFKGRGAHVSTKNPFSKLHYSDSEKDGLDEPFFVNDQTQVYFETPKKALTGNESPDIPFDFSINPYQGCEHGCSYCYARPVHQYWGFNAGYDFESKIIVKRDLPQTLEKQFKKKRYNISTIMLSGNTDCYQPLERQYKITRSILEVMLKYRHPVGIITKNALILRDLDMLEALAKWNLVHVNITITTLNEPLRRKLEPRTATSKARLHVVKTLSEAGVPVGVMMAPIIPSLNDDEIQSILCESAKNGALSAAFTLLRLNGPLADIFSHWLDLYFPDRKDKILNKVKDFHGGSLNDSQFGRRLRGEGVYAETIKNLFYTMKKKYFNGRHMPSYDTSLFAPNGQLGLFNE